MTTSLRKRLVRGCVVVCAAAGVYGVAPASPALAGIENYCVTSLGINAECAGPRHSLRSNQVFGNGSWIGARANDVNGNAYGTYISGVQYACHPYSGANLLYPVIGHFFEYATIGVAGTQAYGSDSQGC